MIDLPRKTSDGIPYTSYSQIKEWNAAKGFNTGKKGYEEFILKYFIGQSFEDTSGFAQFGNEVEAYILNKSGADKFSERERKVLDKISPLGIPQLEILIDFGEFKLKGFIDDSTPDLSHIRDYKTASLNSSKQYYEDEYRQLDVYALGVKSRTGELPSKLEVCVIERLGNGFRGGRAVMSVGDNVWYIHKPVVKDRLEYIQKHIKSTVEEISKYYSIFKKLNK